MHILQSEAWEECLQKDGEQTHRWAGEGWSALAVQKKTPVGSYLFLPYGPAILDAEHRTQCLQDALQTLSERARSLGCLFVRCEPTFAVNAAQMRSQGLVEAKEIDPKHTWVLDLADQTEAELLAGMEKNKPRSWRNMANKGMSVRTTQEPAAVTELTRLLAAVGEQDHFTPQAEAHLRHQLEAGFATLYLVDLAEAAETDSADAVSKAALAGGVNPVGATGEVALVGAAKKAAPADTTATEAILADATDVDRGVGSQVIAAALVYDYDGVRYYAHAAADYEHRKLRAGTVLLVQMILDAARAGQQTFDFWGITTSTDPQHPWAGFTQYKKSFGGRQVDYAGTWDLPLNKRKYQLYKTLRQVNLRVRKLRK